VIRLNFDSPSSPLHFLSAAGPIWFGAEVRLCAFQHDSLFTVPTCPFISGTIRLFNKCEGFKWQVSWVLCVAALWCQGTKKPTSVLLSYTIGGVLTKLVTWQSSSYLLDHFWHWHILKLHSHVGGASYPDHHSFLTPSFSSKFIFLFWVLNLKIRTTPWSHWCQCCIMRSPSEFN